MGIYQDDIEYNKWIEIVREALLCFDKKYFYWHHLPCAGGIYDQDEFIMTIWNAVADAYIIAIQNESILNVMKANQKKE